MTREYLRVTPTSAGLDPDVVSTAIASLHKLSKTDSEGVIARLTPFRSEQPVTFEFLAISDGTNEPVEFYYGADTKLDVLRQRLRSIYPDSFDIDRAEVDIVRKLIQPVEQRPAEYTGRLEEDQLPDPDAVASPTNQNPPIGTDGGTVRARPSLEDATPYGVRWRGSVDRRKDWMTLLTDFSETITPTHNHGDEENPHSGRAPLAPLIDHLTDAAQPLAFQVVFQRKPDWSRQARRRSGALLAGKNTLLQKLLSIESPSRRRDSHRAPTGNRYERHRPGVGRDRLRAPQTKMRDRERDQETEMRLDHLRENTPQRTFTANACLLEHGWEATKDEFERNLERVKEALDDLTDEEIMRDDDLARHAFHQVGAYEGPTVFLYTEHATGIRHRGQLDRLLEESEELWIVPADVHF